MATIHRLDSSGDTAVEFDVETGIGVQLAEQLFREALVRGYVAVEIKGDGSKEAIRAFDPAADQIVLYPRLVGG